MGAPSLPMEHSPSGTFSLRPSSRPQMALLKFVPLFLSWPMQAQCRTDEAEAVYKELVRRVPGYTDCESRARVWCVHERMQRSVLTLCVPSPPCQVIFGLAALPATVAFSATPPTIAKRWWHLTM
jgi:hypothetical protein